MTTLRGSLGHHNVTDHVGGVREAYIANNHRNRMNGTAVPIQVNNGIMGGLAGSKTRKCTHQSVLWFVESTQLTWPTLSAQAMNWPSPSSEDAAFKDLASIGWPFMTYCLFVFCFWCALRLLWKALKKFNLLLYQSDSSVHGFLSIWTYLIVTMHLQQDSSDVRVHFFLLKVKHTNSKCTGIK